MNAAVNVMQSLLHACTLVKNMLKAALSKLK